MKLRTILIDDERNAIDFLQSKLSGFQEIEVVGTASSVAEGLEIIGNQPFDLLFLDIELRDGTGFDLLKHIETIDFFIVFVTAYNQYAVEAFKVHAIDYLLKPINNEELENAIQTVKIRIAEKNPDVLAKINSFIDSTSKPEKIALRGKGKITFVDASKVIYIKAQGQYCEVITTEKSYVNSSHLGHYETLSEKFLRIHRSHIVNLDHVKEVLPGDQYLIMSNNEKLPFSNGSKKEILNKLGI